MRSLDLHSRKLWLAGGAAVALLIILAFWLLAISPKRSDTASLRAEAADTQLQNAQLTGQEASLVRQSKHLPAYQAKLAKALAALPSQSELSIFTRSLTAYAANTGVELTSISVGAPSVAAAAAPVTPTPEATDTTDTSSESDTSESAVVPAPTTSAAGPLSTTFTVTASGTPAQELAFLSAVRTGPRSALITSVQMTSGTTNLLTAQVDVFSSGVPADQVAQLRRLLQPAK